jgi:DNA polymerase-3 subunit alpha
MSITHLSVHSWYTLLGATAPVESLAQRAAAQGMTHLALTDTHALYGAVAFARACTAAGVQPIIGMTARLPAPAGLDDDGPPGELTLLANGPAGYRSLCRLSSSLQAGASQGAPAPAALDWETLAAHAAGLVCLSGGRRGWVDRLLRRDDRAAAARVVSRLAGIFGEAAWLALELHGRPDDGAVMREIVALSDRFGLGAVAVQPVYCLAPDERPRLRLLAAIARNKPLADLTPADLPDGGDPALDLHWLDPAQMAARFAAFPAALAATAQIAAGCAPALPDGAPIWPVLALPANATPDGTLAEQAQAGLVRHYGAQQSDGAGWAARQARLAAELAAISRHGFAPLFLLVADIVRFARQEEIPVSTRGSVANSLVAFCVGITTVDPIEHDLLFERFLNPARTSLPDIDLDFCSVRRDEVLEYVRRTYGAERVALVATISTLRLRSALRETAKAHGIDEKATDRLVRLLPDDWHPDPRRRTRQTLETALAAVEDVRLHPVIRDAFSLLRQPDHLSVHPGGVVIAPGPLTDYVPVQWAPKGFLITQFDHGDVETIGLPKIDLLGIRALTVLADAAALVRRWYDPAFRLAELPLDDPATGDMIEQGATIGVFQCESSGAQRTLRQLKARTVQDLAIANAFFKPGPALGGMAQHFVRRYRGEEPVRYLHPALEPILRRTKGVLIFQEQILRIAREIAGLSWAEADRLRKGMSKFQGDEIRSLRDRFVAGCQRPAPDGPGLSTTQAATLWEQVEPFAGYGFNQGHATAYADVSYRSAYLKAHWPAAFLAARLANWGGFHHPAIYIAEAQRLGIAVHPPHVNYSDGEFTLVELRGARGEGRRNPHRERERADRRSPLHNSNFTIHHSQFALPATTVSATSPALYMGLHQVRDLRQTTVQSILAGRPFADLSDLLTRVPLQEKEATHLIQCGALDGLGESRAALLAEADRLRRAGVQQIAFGFMDATAPPPEDGATRLAWEQHVLGLPVSVHPLALATRAADATLLAQLADSPGKAGRVAGVRLPGWTGGKGFFLHDGVDFAIAVPPKGAANPPVWQPFVAQGRWRRDEWGGGWVEIERVEIGD